MLFFCFTGFSSSHFCPFWNAFFMRAPQYKNKLSVNYFLPWSHLWAFLHSVITGLLFLGFLLRSHANTTHTHIQCTFANCAMLNHGNFAPNNIVYVKYLHECEHKQCQYVYGKWNSKRTGRERIHCNATEDVTNSICSLRSIKLHAPDANSFVSSEPGCPFLFIFCAKLCAPSVDRSGSLSPFYSHSTFAFLRHHIRCPWYIFSANIFFFESNWARTMNRDIKFRSEQPNIRYRRERKRDKAQTSARAQQRNSDTGSVVSSYFTCANVIQ